VSEVQVESPPSRAKTKVFCARCGAEGYMTVSRRGGNAYYYVKHVESEGGAKKARWCYLGPDEYIYVEHFNELGLAGMHDSGRYLRYAQFLVSRLGPEELLELRRMIDDRLREVGRSGA
jgi:hypothetical protein